jgi:hypothetical protein
MKWHPLVISVMKRIRFIGVNNEIKLVICLSYKLLRRKSSTIRCERRTIRHFFDQLFNTDSIALKIFVCIINHFAEFICIKKIVAF